MNRKEDKRMKKKVLRELRNAKKLEVSQKTQEIHPTFLNPSV